MKNCAAALTSHHSYLIELAVGAAQTHSEHRIHIRTNEHRGIPNVRSVCVCAHRLQSCRRPHSPVSSRPITSICAHTLQNGILHLYAPRVPRRACMSAAASPRAHTLARALCALWLSSCMSDRVCQALGQAQSRWRHQSSTCGNTFRHAEDRRAAACAP